MEYDRLNIIQINGDIKKGKNFGFKSEIIKYLKKYFSCLY